MRHGGRFNGGSQRGIEVASRTAVHRHVNLSDTRESYNCEKQLRAHTAVFCNCSPVKGPKRLKPEWERCERLERGKPFHKFVKEATVVGREDSQVLEAWKEMQE